MPVTAAATPQRTHARSAASRSLSWAAAPAYVPTARSFDFASGYAASWTGPPRDAARACGASAR
jgi:hypothetical protein